MDDNINSEIEDIKAKTEAHMRGEVRLSRMEVIALCSRMVRVSENVLEEMTTKAVDQMMSEIEDDPGL